MMTRKKQYLGMKKNVHIIFNHGSPLFPPAPTGLPQAPGFAFDGVIVEHTGAILARGCEWVYL